MIPDSYIDITAEKIRIYKQLDSMTSDKEIARCLLYTSFDDELTGMQQRNIEKVISCSSVIDRTSLILEIFGAAMPDANVSSKYCAMR